MTPREVIARALAAGVVEARHVDVVWHTFLQEADAVIDALEKMEPTDAMIEAYLDQTGDPLSEFGWTAAVEAMRDE